MSNASDENRSSNATPAAGNAGGAVKKIGAATAAGSRRAFTQGVRWADRRNPATLAWIGIAFAAVILLAGNLLVSTWFKSWRADLTEDGLYTISDSTRRVLKAIDEPISMQMYFTKALGEQAPQYGAYFERVRAMLERFRDMSGGKLKIDFISPQPFSEAEDRAVGSGLRGIRLNPEGDMAYFGLVATNTTDNVETVGFFSPERERFLEYDLVKLVHTLSKPKKKVVGLITGLPLEGSPGNPMMGGRPTPPWAILGQIGDFFEVKSLTSDIKEIPADIDTLMLVQPSGLTPQAAYAIDQFALKGGRLLIFLDPVPEVGRMFMMGRSPGEPKELEKLLAAWGVKYDPKKVAADITSARRVQFGGEGGSQPSVTQYVPWLTIGRRGMDASNTLTAGVETLNVASMGVLEPADKATTKLLPILKTSERSMIVDSSKIGLRPDPLDLLRNYKPGGKPLIVAARLTGDIKTAFPNGPAKADGDKKGDADKKAGDNKTASGKAADKPSDGNAAKDAKATKEATKDVAKDAATAKDAKAKAAEGKPAPGQVTSGKINAVIIADTDLLHDQFWIDEHDFLGQRIQIPTAHNSVFVVNAIENLTGGEALRDLRGRGVKPRPFVVVDNIRRDAEGRFRREQESLEKKLKDVQTKLAGVEQKGEGGKVIISDKDRETIEKFRTEMLAIRRQLRDVKLNMRQDIDQLDTTLKFINIAAVPLLIGFGAIGLALLRRRSDRASRGNGTRNGGVS